MLAESYKTCPADGPLSFAQKGWEHGFFPPAPQAHLRFLCVLLFKFFPNAKHLTSQRLAYRIIHGG
jgi:hypothetical protein